MKNKSRIQYNNYAISADSILITSDYFPKFICKYNQPFSISDLKASAVFELIHTTLFKECFHYAVTSIKLHSKTRGAFISS